LSLPLGLGILALVLVLQRGKGKLLADAASQLLPETDVLVLVPAQDANPRLDVVVKPQNNVLLLSDLAAGVGDLVLGLLVSEFEETTGEWCGLDLFLNDRTKTNSPAGIDSLALGTALELLHGHGADVLEMVGAGVGNDGVPDDSLIGVVVGAGPFGGHVDEELLGVPCEERRKVGIEGELDDGILLLLGAIVMRAALDTRRRSQLARDAQKYRIVGLE
jgi:hypothetical protein